MVFEGTGVLSVEIFLPPHRTRFLFPVSPVFSLPSVGPCCTLLTDCAMETALERYEQELANELNEESGYEQAVSVSQFGYPAPFLPPPSPELCKNLFHRQPTTSHGVGWGENTKSSSHTTGRGSNPLHCHPGEGETPKGSC